MSRTIPELYILIEDAKTTLYALYAERTQLRKVIAAAEKAERATKPPRIKGRPLETLIIDHVRSGMSIKEIAKVLDVSNGAVRYHITHCARRLARDAVPVEGLYDDGAWRKRLKLQEQLIKSNFNELPTNSTPQP